MERGRCVGGGGGMFSRPCTCIVAASGYVSHLHKSRPLVARTVACGVWDAANWLAHHPVARRGVPRHANRCSAVCRAVGPLRFFSRQPISVLSAPSCALRSLQAPVLPLNRLSGLLSSGPGRPPAGCLPPLREGRRSAEASGGGTRCLIFGGLPPGARDLPQSRGVYEVRTLPPRLSTPRGSTERCSFVAVLRIGFSEP